MTDDATEQLRENARAPASASDAAGSFSQHRLTDQIEMDRYLASKEAARRKRLGIAFKKLVPPGTD